MTDYQPIACQSYDYLEIACMDRYELRVYLGAGRRQGIATGLETRSGSEFLLLQQTESNIERIRVDRILRIEVITRPARFTQHEFGDARSDDSGLPKISD